MLTLGINIHVSMNIPMLTFNFHVAFQKLVVFRVGKGPTVTSFDEKGQIIITGRRDTGHRAIVE